MPSPERPNKSPAVVRSQSLAASYSRRGESQINACSSLNTWQKCWSVSQKKERGSISCRMSTVNTTTSAHEHMGMQLLKCLSNIKLCKSTCICFPTTNCKCTGIFIEKCRWVLPVSVIKVSVSSIRDKCADHTVFKLDFIQGKAPQQSSLHFQLHTDYRHDAADQLLSPWQRTVVRGRS